MPVPNAKVEVRFDGVNWTDVTASVVARAGISIQRGRDNESGDIMNVGTCSLTLENNDGQFSPSLPSSTHYPYVVEGVAIRVSMWANGAYRRRFYGTVQSWSVSWLNQAGTEAVTLVTANDTFGEFPSYTFGAAVDEIIKNVGASYHWTLRDSSSPAHPILGVGDLADNGKAGWGEGGLCAMDEGTDKYAKFVGLSTGLKLTSPALNIGTQWSVGIVIPAAPTANCDILTITLGGYPWTISYNAGAFTQSLGGMGGGTVGSPAGYPALLVMANTFDGTEWTNKFAFYHPEGFDYGYELAGSPVNSPLQGIVVNPTLTGGSIWSAGHLLIAPSDQSFVTPLQALLAPSRIPVSGSAISFLSDLAGGPTILGGTAGEAALPLLDRDASDAIATLTNGMGARLIDNLDGTLTWVPFPGSATAIALPPGEIDPTVSWQTDSTSWMSDLTVTWPDGATYTATRPDGKRKNGPGIEGVHPTRSQDRDYADWLIAAASTGAKMPQAPYDLATLSDAIAETVCTVGPGSHVTLSSLPTQMPTDQSLVCEGLDEAITDAAWTVTLKLGSGFYSRLFILDDPVQSQLDAGFLLYPFAT